MITIIVIGKKHEAWVQAGIERYERRLKQPWNVEWVLVPHSGADGLRARQDESQRILERLKDDDYVILLDETGKNITSPYLSQFVSEQFSSRQRIVAVIGGAYGVSDALKERANFTWSLSRLVFAHQIVRLILIEQVYRAQAIATGGKYHHQ